MISYAAISDRGTVRRENQDNLYCNGTIRNIYEKTEPFKVYGSILNKGLFAVADGMGGEENGNLAAWETVCILKQLDLNSDIQGLLENLMKCNHTICNKIRENENRRMGSTIAEIRFLNGWADVVNLGDSRVYLIRNGTIRQLSRNHTLIQPLLDRGLLTEKEADKHPDKHRLTQYLGIFPEEMIIEPFTTSIKVVYGDYFLLCSDGLTDKMTDSHIMEIINTSKTLQEKAETLVSQALLKGSRDNITVILANVSERSENIF